MDLYRRALIEMWRFDTGNGQVFKVQTELPHDFRKSMVVVKWYSGFVLFEDEIQATFNFHFLCLVNHAVESLVIEERY